MATLVCRGVVAWAAMMLAHPALAQDKPELTPAGKAILRSQIELDGRPLFDRPGPSRPMTFPLASCAFPGGLCGAVWRDGTVAVQPRYDWVGTFYDNRAAVRLGGLYGFVDEQGREVMAPRYRIVGDYRFGFAQVDVDGKSGLIDRDGTMVMAPKYELIEAIGPDRFLVSDQRFLGGSMGAEDFSESRSEFLSNGIVGLFREDAQRLGNADMRIIDLSGNQVEIARSTRSPQFNKDDSSVGWRRQDGLWGLARTDGSWLVEPKFQQSAWLVDGLARVSVNGKFGFIDATGKFVIAPLFDRAWDFTPGSARTAVAQDGVAGVIDRAGAWIFRTDYQQVYPAVDSGLNPASESLFGWHFKKSDRWGLLDLDGRVLIEADFDQSVRRCADGKFVTYKNRELLSFGSNGRARQPMNGRLLDATCDSVPPLTVKTGDKFELVDADLRPVMPVQFEAVVPAGRSAKNVKLNGKWGRIGPDGRWLIEPKFDYLSGEPDLFVASVDGRRGFMRSEGSWLIEPKFDAAARRRGDDSAFVTLDGATGILALKDQSWVVPPRPGVLCDINYALMRQSDGKRAILSRTGETWIDIGAERIGTSLEFGLLTFLKDGKWGLVDTDGKVTIEPQFDDPVYFGSNFRGVAWARRDTKWCAIDRHGRFVPGIACTDKSPAPGGQFVCKVER